MSKYDGPSYKKDQKRLKKSEFPFYRDSAQATKKDNLFDRSKTSKFEKPIKITREINVDVTEKLFSEEINKSNDERKKWLSNENKDDSKTAQLSSYKKSNSNKSKEDSKSAEMFKRDEATYQKRRSSTPFKVQKIPSPYYGFNKNLKIETAKVNYKKILRTLEKKEDDFILSIDHLCEPIINLDDDENKTNQENQKVLQQPSLLEQPKKKLSRSLSAMIEEERDNQINRQNKGTSYFNTINIVQETKKNNKPRSYTS